MPCISAMGKLRYNRVQRCCTCQYLLSELLKLRLAKVLVRDVGPQFQLPTFPIAIKPSPLGEYTVQDVFWSVMSVVHPKTGLFRFGDITHGNCLRNRPRLASLALRSGGTVLTMQCRLD